MFANGLARQFNAIGIVSEAVQDDVGGGAIADDFEFWAQSLRMTDRVSPAPSASWRIGRRLVPGQAKTRALDGRRERSRPGEMVVVSGPQVGEQVFPLRADINY
ncbi:hypothetical protein [Mesorhizobium sp. BHbdii]